MKGKKTRNAARRAHSKKRSCHRCILHVSRGELPWTAHMFEKDRTALLLLAKERGDWTLEVLPVGVGRGGSLFPYHSFVVSKDGYDELVREFVELERPDKHGVLYLQEVGGSEIALSVGLEGGEVVLDLFRAEGGG